MINHDFPLLDHGYIDLVEKWGSDSRIIEAARMSTNKGFLGWERETWWRCGNCGYTCVNDVQPWVGAAIKCPTCTDLLMDIDKEKSHRGDKQLLKYLYEHKHLTPFEMAGLTIEVQAPIFVFREWHRHRTQSYNELSARYTALPDLYYVPSLERLMASAQSASNQQGSQDGLTPEVAAATRTFITESHAVARKGYEAMLAAGVAREVARVVAPVAQYSRMRASANLRNWLGFLTLRTAPGAQWEIRQYAHTVAMIVRDQFPHTFELFVKGLP